MCFSQHNTMDYIKHRQIYTPTQLPAIYTGTTLMTDVGYSHAVTDVRSPFSALLAKRSDLP